MALSSTAGLAAAESSAKLRSDIAPPHVIPCEVIFDGRIVDVSRPEHGYVTLTVVVDVVQRTSSSVCAPAGTFRVRLPASHPLAGESPAARRNERQFRAVGHTGVTTETTDLVVVGGRR